MKRRTGGRPRPPTSARRSTVAVRTNHTTVTAPPPATPPRPRLRAAKPPARRPPTRQIARIVDEDEASVLDLLDNLLAKGVMLNADLILALADVDLVYVRLSALLCASDRIQPRHASK